MMPLPEEIAVSTLEHFSRDKMVQECMYRFTELVSADGGTFN